MAFVLTSTWTLLFVAFGIGGGFGWFSQHNRPVKPLFPLALTPLRVWIAVGIFLLLLIEYGVASSEMIAGRLGLWLEMLFWLSVSYLVGCVVGSLLARRGAKSSASDALFPDAPLSNSAHRTVRSISSDPLTSSDPQPVAVDDNVLIDEPLEGNDAIFSKNAHQDSVSDFANSLPDSQSLKALSSDDVFKSSSSPETLETRPPPEVAASAPFTDVVVVGPDEDIDIPLEPHSDASQATALAMHTAPRRPVSLASADEGKPDNLKLIKGIGPGNEKRLNELGIWHYHQIAAWEPAEIDWINASLKFSGRVEREKWVEQARSLCLQNRS